MPHRSVGARPRNFKDENRKGPRRAPLFPNPVAGFERTSHVLRQSIYRIGIISIREKTRNANALGTILTTKTIKLPSDQEASGRNLGRDELANVSEVLASGILTSTKGRFVKKLEAEFAEKLGVKHIFACSSGTAAVHSAIAAIDPEPGDEIITSPITDMGALTPILYQGAIPAFAEVDPKTWNVTVESIEAALSERTRAIVVTHLFGNPCDMDEIMALAESRSIPVIEDCAQAFLSQHRDRFVGTIGKIACFSLQQGKHITTGEGGLVGTNDDQLARRLNLFINKGWGYGDAEPDHYFLALNYRMSELQGAVGVGQLPKLQQAVEKRIAAAQTLTKKLAGLPGIETPYVHSDSVHTYWKYCLRVDSDVIPGGCLALGRELTARQVSCAPRYIQKPAFMCKIFQEQKTLGTSRFPFTLARPAVLQYEERRFPLTKQALQNVLVLPWNENYLEEHISHISDTIHDSVLRLLN
jgi:perosamine synthetase